MIDSMGFELTVCHEEPAIHTNVGVFIVNAVFAIIFIYSRYFEQPTIKMASSVELEQFLIGMSLHSWDIEI